MMIPFIPLSSACREDSTLGIIPPEIVPFSISAAISASLSSLRTFPFLRIPGISERNTSRDAGSSDATSNAASSALMFRPFPASSIDVEATTGRYPASSSTFRDPAVHLRHFSCSRRVFLPSFDTLAGKKRRIVSAYPDRVHSPALEHPHDGFIHLSWRAPYRRSPSPRGSSSVSLSRRPVRYRKSSLPSILRHRLHGSE